MARIPFSASERAAITRLSNRLASDKKFANALTAFKPGDEDKIKDFLAEKGFKGVHVSTELKTIRICFCSTFIKGLCICVQYSS
jgi:hypothetical protein